MEFSSKTLNHSHYARMLTTIQMYVYNVSRDMLYQLIVQLVHHLLYWLAVHVHVLQIFGTFFILL